MATEAELRTVPNRWRTLFRMTIASALFAAMNAFAHHAAAHAPVLAIAATRAAVGALVALTVALFRGHPPSEPNILRSAFLGTNARMWGRTLFGTAAMACTFYALGDQRLPLGDAATLFNLSPILVAFLAPFLLGERSDRRLVLTLPVALVGVLAILRPSFLRGGAPPLPSATLGIALAAAGFSAFAMILLRSTSESAAGAQGREAPKRVEAVALHFSTFAAFVFLFATIVTGELSTFEAWRTELPSMIAAGLAAGCAQLAMTEAYRHDRAARVAALGYLNVPMSALLGAYVHGAWPTAITLFGMLLVVGSGVASVLPIVLEDKKVSDA